MADLAGKRVIVTGGSTGIGAAIADRFLADGAKVCVWGQSQERLDAITAKLPKLSAAISVDVADADAVDPAFERSLESLGGLDVLICNAGISIRHDFVDIERKDFERILKVNLFGDLLRQPARGPPHAARRRRGDPVHGLDQRRHRLSPLRRLQRQQGRHDRADADHGAGAGAQGARQCRQPRLHPDADAGGGIQHRPCCSG